MPARRFRPFRLGLWLGVLGAAAWFVQRYQRAHQDPAPVGAPVERPAPPPTPPTPVVASVAEPVAPPEAEPAPAPVAKAVAKKKAAAKKKAPARVAAAWVAPDEAGVCPASHPVKAKLTSKLFHLPGMFAYARTNPDRCYRDEATAEADGLTRAKR